MRQPQKWLDTWFFEDEHIGFLVFAPSGHNNIARGNAPGWLSNGAPRSVRAEQGAAVCSALTGRGLLHCMRSRGVAPGYVVVPLHGKVTVGVSQRASTLLEYPIVDFFIPAARPVTALSTAERSEIPQMLDQLNAIKLWDFWIESFGTSERGDDVLVICAGQEYPNRHASLLFRETEFIS